jgi:hypothetical protein
MRGSLATWRNEDAAALDRLHPFATQQCADVTSVLTDSYEPLLDRVNPGVAERTCPTARSRHGATQDPGAMQYRSVETSDF